MSAATRSRITILRHGSGQWDEPAPGETIATVDRLKAAVGNGSLLRHLFRYDEARILTHRLETIGRPLKLALFLRLLSHGACAVEDESGRRRPLTARLISRWAWQAMREPFKKTALLESIDREATALSSAASHRAIGPLRIERPPLYLRTDMSFGLKAGGSVGHTAGVVNHLGAFSGTPIMLTTDIVPTVSESVETHTVAPAEAFWEYPELPTLVMNERFSE